MPAAKAARFCCCECFVTDHQNSFAVSFESILNHHVSYVVAFASFKALQLSRNTSRSCFCDIRNFKKPFGVTND